MIVKPIHTPTDLSADPLHFIVDQDLTDEFTSEVLGISDISGPSIHLILTGTMEGSFDLQGSNKPDSEDEDFVSISIPAGQPALEAVGDDINFLLNISSLNCAFIRLVWTPTDGEGEVNGYVFGKAS